MREATGNHRILVILVAPLLPQASTSWNVAAYTKHQAVALSETRGNMRARKGGAQQGFERSLRVVRAQPSDPVELSIVIPAFNEGSRIADGLDELSATIDRGKLGRGAIEVLVVDDGSTDGTPVEVQRKEAAFADLRLIRRPRNMGKGAAVRAGVAEASGTFIAFMDADMAVGPSFLPSLVGQLNGVGMAIGSRAIAGSSTADNSFDRVVIGRTFNGIVSFVTGLPFRDTQCGFKAFRAPVARILFHYSQVDGFAFDVDLLIRARQLGIEVAEVPVHWRQIAGSHIRPLFDPYRMVVDLLSLSWAGREPPAMPAVVIAGPRSRRSVAAIHDVLGPTVPVVPWEDEGYLVLFPMCDSLDVERQLRLLEQSLETPTLRAFNLTADQVQGFIPSLVAASTFETRLPSVIRSDRTATTIENAQPLEPGALDTHQ